MGNELRAPDNEDIGRFGGGRACCVGGMMEACCQMFAKDS